MPYTVALYTTLLLGLFWVWAALWRPRAVPGVNQPAPLLIGHRGVRGGLSDTPSENLAENPVENSVAAFERAFDAGLDGVETDVQCTRDGTLVLYHDFALPDGRGVTALPLAELNVAVPSLATLDELFETARRYPGTLLNLELKTKGWRTGGLERRTVRAVRASGLAARVLISSFNPLSLLRVRLYAPTLRAAFLYAPEGPPLLRSEWVALMLARALHLDALHPHHSSVTPSLVRAAARRGLPIHTWTVNDAERVKDLTRLNVNGLMADSPKALKDAFNTESV